MPKRKPITISAFEKRQIRFGCLDIASRIFCGADGNMRLSKTDDKDFIDFVNKLSKFVETGEVLQ